MTTTTTIAGTWHDRLLEPAHRADLLLAEMTVAEKCHQLTVTHAVVADQRGRLGRGRGR